MRFGNVDYRELGNRKGPAEFLAGLINRELREPEPASAVIFLGPLARSDEEVPKSAIKGTRSGPKFFYLQPNLSDSWVQRMVRTAVSVNKDGHNKRSGGVRSFSPIG